MTGHLSICLISREYPPFYAGGIGSYTVRWSRVLADAGHRVVVITVSEDGAASREADGPVTVVRLPLVQGHDWSRPAPSIDSPWTRAAFTTFSPVSVFAMQIAEALPGLHAEFNFDIVEAPDTGALHWFALNDRRTGSRAREPMPAFVTGIHSPSDWIARWNRTPLQGRPDHELAAMERDAARWSDGLVCPSTALATEAAELWSPETGIEVIPYPLGELEAQGGAGQGRSGPGSVDASMTGSTVRLLYTGRLEPRKGIDTLLEGLGLALGAGANLELDLVGEDMHHAETAGPFGQAMLGRHIPAEHRARVRLRGKQPPETVAYLQQRADAIVVPAPMDNFPNTCIEAMARARVVIAANAGGMAEMIRHRTSGLLFEPGNAASLAAVLQSLATMPAHERAALGRGAGDRVRELCGNQRVLAARIAHYRQAIARRAEGMSAPRAERATLVVNAGSAAREQLEALRAAVADPASGVDFAHAWLERSGEAVVFGTPSLDTLGYIDPEIGPLVVAVEALTPEARKLITRTPESHRAVAKSTWAIAAVLAAAGRPGAVLPQVRVRLHRERFEPAAAPEASLAQTRAELAAARAELRRIHASKGWRALQHIYGLLHILKGRGLSRREYHPRSQEPGA